MANKLCSTREILFRGKRTDNREWAEGLPGYDVNGNVTNIEVFRGYSCCYPLEVDPETICRYTGLTDKNGRKIFGGDIIQFEDTGEEGYEYKEGFDFTNKAKVVWNKGRFELDSFLSNNSGVLETMNGCPDEFYSMFGSYSEVIGNMFDNPELIEQGDDAE